MTSDNGFQHFSEKKLIKIYRQSYGEGGARGQRRAVVVVPGLIVEDVVDGGIDVDASPQVVLQHQPPDGVALVHVAASRLRLALTAAREGCIEGVVAREAVLVA